MTLPGFSISEKMRWQIRGLNQASENIQDGSSLTNVADGALGEVHSILQRQRELLVQAANDTNTSSDRQAIEDELGELSKEFDRIFNDTEFNTQQIFKGQETYLAGPTLTTTPQTLVDTTINGTPQTTNKVVWLPKSPAPDLNPPDTVTQNTTTVTSTEYLESETLNSTDNLGHSSFDVEETYRTTVTTTDSTTTTEVSYIKSQDPDYTNLRNPQTMVGANGYINIKNIKGDLDLSCAMSQLGVKVDGQILSLDLYSDTKYPRTTAYPDATSVETTYDLGDGVLLTQCISLINNDQYDISYRIDNTGTASHTVDVRLAFDVMNTDANSVDNGSSTFNLQTDYAEINISGTGTTNAVLGNIEELYGRWDERVDDGDPVTGKHTGAGFWWENNTVNDGGSLTVGPVNYGPITLLKDPYVQTTTVTTDKDIKTIQTDVTNAYTYQPKYLDIQSGAKALENIPIRLYNLSSQTLRLRVPGEMSAFNADSSLTEVDRVIGKISSIRSYYGAITNRLDHAKSNDDNTSENTQAAESRIRDTDMAKEMVDFSKNSILSQSGQAILAQSNHIYDQVLELLQ